MKLRETRPVHLTYCLNVHRGETWEENLDAIRTFACAVKARVAPEAPFGLGLRLSRVSADSLAARGALDGLKTLLSESGLYAFTVNGFPYGPFHGTSVKESAYAPDWRRDERLRYTARLAEILAELLPAGVSGSVSTVPGSYKAWIRSDDDVERMARNLASCAERCARIEEQTGRTVHVGLEPEPDCLLETTAEALAFFKDVLLRRAPSEETIRRHVGVCFDACHMALAYEDLEAGIARLRAEGVRISKVHLSAAIAARVSGESLEALGAFCDPVYLHQVKLRDGQSFSDLSEFLAAGAPPGTELRVHCHVPLYFSEFGGLGSTASSMTDGFFRELLALDELHLEIETYTFDVLPPELRTLGVVESTAREYGWVLERLRPHV